MLWDIYTTASGLPILRFGEGNGGATTAIAVVGYPEEVVKKAEDAPTCVCSYPTTAIAVVAPPFPPPNLRMGRPLAVVYISDSIGAHFRHHF